MTGASVRRYEVPVDDNEHEILDRIVGAAFRVEMKTLDVVEFWATHDPHVIQAPRRILVQVVGTGHPVPKGWWLAGTTSRHPSGIVWHLLMRVA